MTMQALASAHTPATTSLSQRGTRRVIFAAALGTMFEWYDFFVYGSLASTFGALFFPKGNETAALLAALATFGAGFVLRPFGAVVFGQLGDLIGRKHTFLVTMLIMGIATAAVGFLPTFETIGWWAPAILVAFRLLQGLAVGGEFGGAVTYVAEHSNDTKRGLATSWIQITATLGLFLSLIVILTCRQSMSAEAFMTWGWRVPFMASIGLLLISLYIRLKLEESPVFHQMKAEQKSSRSPIGEVFGNRRHLRVVMIAIFGAVAGQAVVWYTAHFYSLYFMTSTLKMGHDQAYTYLMAALFLATPFFLFFGWLSDQIGRKWIVLSGCALAALLYMPLFQELEVYGNPTLAEFRAKTRVEIQGNDCSADQSLLGQMFQPTSTKPCTRMKSFLAGNAVPFEVVPGATTLTARVGDQVVNGFDEAALRTALIARGLPTSADPTKTNGPMVTFVLFVMVLIATMVYGPMGALLVELFPTRIRYSGVSVALQFGNGWIGGFAPFVATAVVAGTGSIFAGLWYTVAFAGLTFLIGAFLLPETYRNDISV